jgi:hypothetical protein
VVYYQVSTATPVCTSNPSLTTCTESCPYQNDCACVCPDNTCGLGLAWDQSLFLADYPAGCYGSSGTPDNPPGPGQHYLYLHYYPSTCYTGVPWEPPQTPVSVGGSTSSYWTGQGGVECMAGINCFEPVTVAYTGNVTISQLDATTATALVSVTLSEGLDSSGNPEPGYTGTVSGSFNAVPCTE